MAGLSGLHCPVDESVPEDSAEKHMMIEVPMDQTVDLVLVAAYLVEWTGEGEEGSLVVWSEWLQRQCAIAESITEQRPSRVMEVTYTGAISTNTSSSKATHKRREQAQGVLVDQAETGRLGSRNFLRRYVSMPAIFLGVYILILSCRKYYT